MVWPGCWFESNRGSRAEAPAPTMSVWGLLRAWRMTGLVRDQVPAGSGRLPDVGRDRGTTPSATLEAQEKVCLPVAWPFVVEQVWDLLGFGRCASPWRELRR